MQVLNIISCQETKLKPQRNYLLTKIKGLAISSVGKDVETWTPSDAVDMRHGETVAAVCTTAVHLTEDPAQEYQVHQKAHTPNACKKTE